MSRAEMGTRLAGLRCKGPDLGFLLPGSPSAHLRHQPLPCALWGARVQRFSSEFSPTLCFQQALPGLCPPGGLLPSAMEYHSCMWSRVHGQDRGLLPSLVQCQSQAGLFTGLLEVGPLGFGFSLWQLCSLLYCEGSRVGESFLPLLQGQRLLLCRSLSGGLRRAGRVPPRPQGQAAFPPLSHSRYFCVYIWKMGRFPASPPVA